MNLHFSDDLFIYTILIYSNLYFKWSKYLNFIILPTIYTLKMINY